MVEKHEGVYICATCNTKTEQWRPWLSERKKIPAISAQVDNVDKKNIPQEETPVEHEPVDSQELGMTHHADQLASASGKSPQDVFVVFPEADNSKGSDSKTTAIPSPEDLTNSDVEHHWSHDLVFCTSPEAVSPPVSLEGRVIGLEKKLHELQEQTNSLQGGMTKLEAQLERLEQLLQTAHVGQ